MSTDPHNPYAPSFSPPALAARNPPGPPLPVFAKTMFIIDLVLSSARGLLALLAIPGYFVLKQQHDPTAATAIPEVITGLAVAFTAIPADILGLLRKRTAVWLGAAACLSVLLSSAVGVWQVSLRIDAFPAGTPQRVGFYIGVGGVLLIRLAIMAAYAGGLAQFAVWSSGLRGRSGLSHEYGEGDRAE